MVYCMGTFTRKKLRIRWLFCLLASRLKQDWYLNTLELGPFDSPVSAIILPAILCVMLTT